MKKVFLYLGICVLCLGVFMPMEMVRAEYTPAQQTAYNALSADQKAQYTRLNNQLLTSTDEALKQAAAYPPIILPDWNAGAYSNMSAAEKEVYGKLNEAELADFNERYRNSPLDADGKRLPLAEKYTLADMGKVSGSIQTPTGLTGEQTTQWGTLTHAQQMAYLDAVEKGSDPAAALEAAGKADKASPPEKAKASDGTCGLFNMTPCLAKVVSFFAYYIIFKLSNLLIFLSGLLLNFIIDVTIVNMAEKISSMDGINIAWKVVRDLMNIGFIFFLLWEGINLIVGTGNLANARKFITGIVLASLLINFSLFFTKVIIDASNVVTIGFYHSIIDGYSADPSVTTEKAGISNAFVGALGLQGFFDGSALKNAGGDEYKLLILELGGSALFLITAFIFLAVSVLFVVRYIIIILLLILSPIGYMGMAFPGMKKMADEWWESLIGQCLFPPMYMMMTWVTLTLIGAKGFLNEQNPSDWSGLAGSKASDFTGVIGLIINFALVIGLAISSLIMAKKYSTQGSKMVGEFSGKATAFAGGALLGGAASLSRNSISRVALGGTSVEQLQVDIAKGGVRGQMAKSRLALATGSFDMRRSKVGETIAGVTGFNFGKGTEGIPFLNNAKAGEGGLVGYRDARKKEKEAIQEAGSKAANKIAVEEAKKTVLAGANADPTTAGGQAAIDAMELALSKLSDKQTESLVAGNKDLLTSLNFANSISVKQLETLNKSEQLSEDEKVGLKNKRFEGVSAIYDPAAIAAHRAAAAIPAASRTREQKTAFELIDNAPKRIKGLTDSEIEMMDPVSLTKSEFISELRPAQFESIAKSSKFTSSQKKTIKDTRLSPLLDALDTSRTGHAPNPTLVKKMITGGLSRKDVAGLMSTKADFMNYAGIAVAQESLLIHPQVMEQYSPGMLKVMAQEMNRGDIKKVRDEIILAGIAPGASANLISLEKWLGTPDGDNFS